MFAASKSGKAAAAAAATDPYFPYVPLLLNTTSTNGQQNNTFLDSSSNAFTITRNGTPTQGAFTPYQPSGYWSGVFNGSSDYLSVPDSVAFTIGTNSFTIEAWIYPTSLPSSGSIANIAAQWVNTASNQAWLFALYNNSGALQLLWQPTSGTTQTVISQNYAFAVNSWYHVAVVKNGTAVTLYVNGTALGAATTYSSSVNDSTANLTIGIRGSLDLPFAGYISNFRIVNGTAIVPPAGGPTAPLTAVANTSLLTLQSNRFIDNSTNAFAITVNGTPKVQAFQPFAPAASYSAATYGGSGWFNGTSDYLSVPTATALNLSTSDFTIEAWIYLNAISASVVGTIIAKYTSGVVATAEYLLQIGTNGSIGIALDGGGGEDYIASSASIFKTNVWYHVAATKSGSGTNNVTLWQNGVQVAQGTSTRTINTTSTALTVGALASAAYFNGYISNVRIVKGTAVYTGAFTPPTLAPLTTAGSTSAASYTSTTNVNTSFAAANTSLLTNFTNAGIYDAAWQNNALTVGDAQVSTTQAQWPTTSMKFDGTGDYLTLVDSPGLKFGSGNFTIEGWVYPTVTSGNYCMYSRSNFAIIVGIASNSFMLYASSNGSSFDLASNVTFGTATANAWNYFAVVRNGTNIYLYVNGTLGNTVAVSTSSLYESTTPTIGNWTNGSANFYMNGYIQDLRITKGVARTITTPTAAFPTR